MDQVTVTVLQDKLNKFKQACVNAGYSSSSLVLEDAYPGISPRVFTINVIIDDVALLGDEYSSTLKQVIKLLYDNTDTEVLKSIHTVRICGNTEDVLNLKSPS